MSNAAAKLAVGHVAVGEVSGKCQGKDEAIGSSFTCARVGDLVAAEVEPLERLVRRTAEGGHPLYSHKGSCGGLVTTSKGKPPFGATPF